MRVAKIMAGVALVLALTAVPGTASAQWQQTAGGWVSGDVEYVDTLYREAGTAVSAKLHGRHLYVTAFRSFSIYDVTDPVKPVWLSTTPLGVQAFNEQPDTNGKVLLLSNDTSALDAGIDPPRLRTAGTLEIWDVRDKTSPQHLASLPLPKREHIWTCVLDCAYAYGGGGAIVDLSDPASPTIVGDWAQSYASDVPGTGFHTVQEVAPGLVLTGAARVGYLDARQDPANPRLLAEVAPELSAPGTPSNPTSLPAHLAWPGATAGSDAGRFLLMSMETPFGLDCDETAGGFRTYDTTDWDTTGTFTFVDEYVFDTPLQADPPTYTNGRAALHAWGCSAYAFDAAEHFGASGQVAVAWFEDGLRLLRVSGDGSIDEVGGFLPAGGSSATPLWRNDEVVYVVDIYRGVDILRIDSGD